MSNPRDLQINSEAAAIVMRSLDRIPGDKIYKGEGSVFICCPHPDHEDHSPSCLLNIVDGDKFKAGTAKCFSHPDGSGFFHWNQIAEWLGLEKIDEDDRQEVYVTRPNFDLNDGQMLGEGDYEQQLDQLCTSLRVPLHLKWTNLKWRGIRAKTLRKIGAHYGLDEEAKDEEKQKTMEQVIILPVIVDGDLVGAIKGKWKKTKRKGESSYINSKGNWAKSKGLFLVDQAVKKGRTAILCEGPRDGLRLLQEGLPGVSTLGAKNWGKEKRDLLLSCGIENVIFCFDQDRAGDEALELVSADCFGYFQCRNFSLRKWGKRLGLENLDPGNMPEVLINKLHTIWSRMEGWEE